MLPNPSILRPDMPHFTLYSRSWCHLCEDLLTALRSMTGESVRIDVIDVDADPLLVEQYDELVPVLVGHWPGQSPEQLCHYHLDEAAVRRFLDGPGAQTGISPPESGKMRP